MSGEQELAPSGDGRGETTGGSGAISNEVRQIDADSPAFLAAVSGCLPPDVVATVLEGHIAFRHRYRRIEILLIVLGLCAVGWFVYLYFPKPIPAAPFQFTWRYSGPRFPGDSPWLKEYRRACGEFEEEHYETALRILKVPLSGMEERIPVGHDELFYLYFVSCERAGNKREWTAAVSWARKLIGNDPDNPMWRYFLVMSLRRSLGSCPDFYRQLRENSLRIPWERKLLDVNQALKELVTLERKLDYRRNPFPRRREISTQLTLFRAELLTLKWMLEGGRGTAVFPDNRDDPGVAAREEAWNSIRNRTQIPFIKLRIFILELLLEQDEWDNFIYWDGRYRTTKNSLASRLRFEREALKGDGGE